MALLTVNGHAAFGGSIQLPRAGAWTADLDLEATEALSGVATIQIPEGSSLVGTFVAGELAHGRLRARIVGGAGGLAKTATPRHYTQGTLRAVLSDLARAAGETLSGAIASSVLGARLNAWTVLGVPIGEQIAALVSSGTPAGTTWRVLPDGTLWVGQETWPDAALEQWRELDRRPREGRLELGLDSPTLLPGTTLGEDRIDYVEHRLLSNGVRATAWLA